MPSFEVTPIGTVRNNRTNVQHTDNWGAVRSAITIDERFGEARLQGLEGFSHVEVLFIFDQFPEHDDYREPRPCRGRSDLPPVTSCMRFSRTRFTDVLHRQRSTFQARSAAERGETSGFQSVACRVR